MAYSLVPNANNTVGSDLTAMYDNFVALESSQIVDSGSTADGDYWRFEDGLQMTVSDFQIDVTTVSYQTLTLPNSYINRESCTVNFAHLSGLPNEALYFDNIKSIVNTDADVVISLKTAGTSSDPTSIAEKLSVMTLGRWK